MSISIPSIQFCITGRLMDNEKYNQAIHNYGRTICERVPQLLDWYSVNEIEIWINNNKNNLLEDQITEIYLLFIPYQTSQIRERE